MSKGMTDAIFGQMMSIVGLVNMNNRLANGFQVLVDTGVQVEVIGWVMPRSVCEDFVLRTRHYEF